ncbi:MAG TPA: glycine cleavage system aminomethyltransferase GcvT [Vicinamibacterales bacterium]|nr:glycine cleavage system aminomethyltransferase GcvT [Vicinamibacterales bacterium]
MSDTSTEQLQKTPLNARHRAHGARMVPFGGWDMPVEYSGIVNEHLTVREKAGLFDVSHMGQVEVAGKDALAAVQKISSNDAAKLSIGQAQYSALTTPEGTFVDDLLVYRLATDHYLLVINAGEIPKKYKWIADHTREVGDVAVVNSSSRYALLAVQGPAAVEIVRRLTSVDLDAIKYYWFAHGEVASVRSMISRTGYTGEDGFELFIPPASAERVWNAILEAGADLGIVPVGLGARDTLRLEAGMHLSGQDIDETTTVLEADLGWIVGWKKADFIGKAALEQQKSAGVARKLVGFEMLAPGIARHGYKAFTSAGEGIVTSGTQTPLLKKAIGFAYLPVAATPLDTEFEIDIRGRRVPARVVPRQFYKRSRS